ncbi:MAG TPA: SIMPL domain-containing protein [Pyrinomonadaceae bacterium]|nr:SIMPL domain-containing protein [Pyrinomonadaceae bacterium]
MKRLLLITGVFALVFGTATVLHAKDITVRGKLQKTVEAGGWLIVSGETKYLVLNARNYQSNDWFKESANVEAVGETKDVMTVYMEGTPFEAKSMKPVEQQAATPGRDDRRATRVMITGDSTVQAQPDTAIVSVSVVTQNKSALEAQQENATKTEAVVRAVKAAAGANAEVKTSGYNVQPQRQYREGQPAVITGYEVRNSVTVTLSELNRVGNVLDAAAQAGSNEVAGIMFTLRQDRPARDRALSEATREAISKAQMIALALGGRVARIVEVQEEGFFIRPPMPYATLDVAMARAGTGAQVQTPIEIGTLEVQSRVQVIAEVERNN